jgi:hypothetical protein
MKIHPQDPKLSVLLWLQFIIFSGIQGFNIYQYWGGFGNDRSIKLAITPHCDLQRCISTQQYILINSSRGHKGLRCINLKPWEENDHDSHERKLYCHCMCGFCSAFCRFGWVNGTFLLELQNRCNTLSIQPCHIKEGPNGKTLVSYLIGVAAPLN